MKKIDKSLKISKLKYQGIKKTSTLWEINKPL